MIARQDVLDLMRQARENAPDFDGAEIEDILADYETDCDAPPFAAEPAGDAVDVRVNLTIDEAGNYLASGSSEGFEMECDWEFQGMTTNVVITARVPLPVVPEIVGTVQPVDAGESATGDGE